MEVRAENPMHDLSIARLHVPRRGTRGIFTVPPNSVDTTQGARPATRRGNAMNSKTIKPVAFAVGAAFIGSLALGQAAQASAFSINDLDAGYAMVDDHAKKKDEKAKEGKCGEGKCGEDKGKTKEREKAKEGKCGEGKCGEGDKKEKGEEGKCGEGKCGEGKCGSV